VQQRMKKEGKIEINQKVLDQLEEASAEPILPAGLNFPQ